MQTAFVVGNGRSRLKIDLQELNTWGTVYGCNAIYRDFTPDHLVAVDEKMLKELNKNRVYDSVPIWTYKKQHRKSRPYNFVDHSMGWSSGPTALRLSVEHGAQRIFILGFDYSGMGNKINNIYAGTENYRGSDCVPTYYRNWLWQTRKTIDDYPQVHFTRVIDQNCLGPNSFQDLTNCDHESVEDFSERIQTGLF